jgi:exopolysaccharide biosynthesis polyprenyl glycosylphosphotransferase
MSRPTVEEFAAQTGPRVEVSRRAPAARVNRGGSRRALAIATDGLAAVLAVVAVGLTLPEPELLDHEAMIAAAAGPLWLILVAVNRGYSRRSFGLGGGQRRPVVGAGVCLLWLVTFGSYALGGAPPRALVPVLAVTSALSLAGRRWSRQLWLRRARAQGLHLHRAVVVGSADSVAAAVQRLRTDPDQGIAPVGACVGDAPAEGAKDLGCADLLVGEIADIESVLLATGSDMVLLVPGSGISGTELRRLVWRVESAHAELVVHAGIVETVAQRVTIGSVGHAPVFRIARAQLSGPARVVKDVFDRFFSALLLLLLVPFMALLAAAIWCADGGSPFFSQARVGLDGREFRIVKFRTMVVDAEMRKATLIERNEADGVLFKIAQDPRTTAIGRLLRRYSIDELPQLMNVLRGEMSLVGPRPPLAAEVAAYSPDMRRRLLVKPGMTGLWQVSGRSQLSWAQSELLDLRYVDNWSLALDISILARTLRAVVGGTGAY